MMPFTNAFWIAVQDDSVTFSLWKVVLVLAIIALIIYIVRRR